MSDMKRSGQICFKADFIPDENLYLHFVGYKNLQVRNTFLGCLFEKLYMVHDQLQRLILQK